MVVPKQPHPELLLRNAPCYGLTPLGLEEMARLSIHDVDHRNGFVRVNKGKFAKDRMTPLGRKACDHIREYLQNVRAEWSGNSQVERALWLSSKSPHGPLKSQAIQVMVKRYGRDAGIEKSVTPHIWRHTCATHLVADGANPRQGSQRPGNAIGPNR